MKVITDISEEDYKYAKRYSNGVCNVLSLRNVSSLIYATANGTPLPDNATNGDVIKAMFPNTKAWVGASSDTTCVEIEGIMQIHLVPTDWWNAPYKENDNANAN